MDKDIHILRWEELPDFPLYIDQVMTIIEKSLAFLNYSDEKIITSTMINNYVKSGIVDAPVKKKYERAQIATFTSICLFKKVFSLEEIGKLLKIQFDNVATHEAYDTFCNVFENVYHDNLDKVDWHINDEEVKALFLKAVQAVVYKIHVEKVIIDEKTLMDMKKEEKKKKKE